MNAPPRAIARDLNHTMAAALKLIKVAAPAAINDALSMPLSPIAVRILPRRSRPKLVLPEVGSASIAQRHDPYRQNRIARRILRRVYAFADRIITLTDTRKIAA